MVRGVKSYEPEKGIDGGFTVNTKSGKAYTLGKSDGFAVGGFGTEKIVDSAGRVRYCGLFLLSMV